jgi:small redox-active disulfide protein 2
MKVRILGAGCSKCRTLEQKIRSLDSTHNLNLDIEKVTDLREIMSYGILATPGLVIDGVVKSAGSVPNDEKLLTWLKGSQQ